MFSNGIFYINITNKYYLVDVSPEFEEFLNWIGDKIELKGFDGYRGGLDILSIKNEFFIKIKFFF